MSRVIAQREGFLVQLRKFRSHRLFDGGDPFFVGNVEILGDPGHEHDVGGLGGTGLLRQGQVNPDNITCIRVPGAIEIPLTVKRAAESGKYDAVIALGCVIRGATYHFEIVANECAKGLTQTMLGSNIPVAFGVLACDTIEQAVQRAGSKAGNKGSEAALSSLEMINVLNNLKNVG